MSITVKTRKILWGRSANRCNFEGCRRELVMDATETDDESIIGEECHIVAREENGPRGESNLNSKDRDKYSNLILMCNVHHKIIDDQPGLYTVEKLLDMKNRHEEWVKSSLDKNSSKPILNIPFNENLNFVGRKKILEKLSNNLENVSIQILSGMSGVGKTQLAIKYAYENIDKYDYIFWVNSDNNINLFNDYVSIGKKLEIIDESNKNQEEYIKEVSQWFSTNENWLLIFDNCEDYKQIYNYIPTIKNGDIIITSKNPNWSELNKPIKVEIFSEDESIDFFINKIDSDCREDIGILSQKLGYLPLALNQAAAYIEENGISFKEYIKLYDKYNLRIFEKNYNEKEYDHTVTSVWKITLNKIKQESNISIKIMKFLALFFNSKIPKNIIINNLEKLTDIFSQEVDILEFNQTISILKRYALIDIDKEYYSMHCLIQMVIRNEIIEENKFNSYIDKVSEYIYDILPNSLEDSSKLLGISDLIPHVNFIINSIERPNEIYIDLRYKFGLILRINAQYNDAKLILEESLKLIDSLNIEYGYESINTMNLLAGILKDMGQLDEALKCYSNILQIIKKNPSMDNIAIINNNIGLIYKQKGKYIEAKEYFEKALENYTKQEKYSIANISTTLANLSAINLQLGKYDEAIKNIEKSLDIISDEYGTDNLQYARALNNKANILLSKEKYQEAKILYEEAIKIDEKFYSNNHKEILTKKSNLALCMCSLSKEEYIYSQSIMKEIISTNINIFGETNIEVAENMYILSEIYMGQEKYNESIETLMKVKNIYLNYYTKFNFKVAELNMRLANCLIKAGGTDNIKLAILLYTEVLDIDKNIKEYSRILDDLLEIGYTLGSLGIYDEAINNFKESIEFIIRKYGEYSSELGYIYLYLSDLYLKNKNYIEAIKCYKYAINCNIDVIEEEFDDKSLGLYSMIIDNMSDDLLESLSKYKLDVKEIDRNLIITPVLK